MGKVELNLLWGVSENGTGNRRVKVTKADVIFMELLNNETGCCVKLSVICPNVPKIKDLLYQLKMSE